MAMSLSPTRCVKFEIFKKNVPRKKKILSGFQTTIQKPDHLNIILSGIQMVTVITISTF